MESTYSTDPVSKFRIVKPTICERNRRLADDRFQCSMDRTNEENRESSRKDPRDRTDIISDGGKRAARQPPADAPRNFRLRGEISSNDTLQRSGEQRAGKMDVPWIFGLPGRSVASFNIGTADASGLPARNVFFPELFER